MKHKVAAGLTVGVLILFQVALTVSGRPVVDFYPAMPQEFHNIVTFLVIPYLLLRGAVGRVKNRPARP